MLFPTQPSATVRLVLILVTLGLVILFVIYSGIPGILLPPPEKPQVRVSQPVGEINANLESDLNVNPQYVQSGYVNIGNPSDPTTYKFGNRGDISKFLQNDEFQAGGIYAYRDNRWQRIKTISQLSNDDFIIATFYSSYSYSDTGEEGETILGIVDWLERDGGQLRLRFLDDPEQKEYSLYRGIEGITRTTPIGSDDPTGGLFDFGDDLFDSIAKGSTLRLLVNDQFQVIAATILAPNMNIISGQVSQLFFSQEESVHKLTLSGREKPIILDRKIKVVQKGAETIPKLVEDMPASAKVRIMYYPWGDKDIAVSLDYE